MYIKKANKCMYVCSRLFISHREFRYEKKIEIIEPLLLENNHIFARNLSKSLFCLLVSHIFFHFAPRLNVNNLGKNYQKCLEKNYNMHCHTYICWFWDATIVVPFYCIVFICYPIKSYLNMHCISCFSWIQVCFVSNVRSWYK